MGDHYSKPWMQPTRYTDDMGVRSSGGSEGRTNEEIDAILNGQRQEREGYGGGGRPVELRDNAPLDYNNRGDRDRDLDLDEREYDSEHTEYVPKPKMEVAQVKFVEGEPRVVYPEFGSAVARSANNKSHIPGKDLGDLTVNELIARLMFVQAELDKARRELDEMRTKSETSVAACGNPQQSQEAYNESIEIRVGNKILLIKSP